MGRRRPLPESRSLDWAVATSYLPPTPFAGRGRPTASASTSGAAPARADRVVRSVGTVAPDRAWHTLSLIDAGQWPPGGGSGTRGGAVWPNRESRLPSARYRQWDVNRRQPGRPRDGERIVTGDDGSAWYTPDLFHTFTRMR
ncbi:ribonuclease domain-containing protein [Streptomyces roseoverticillatus]|uniref:ribonuclease domain-containing protein n=1 Tax=Streptomyces roseoverticillatus TaxID=66429 RepID=UPI0033C0E73A